MDVDYQTLITNPASVVEDIYQWLKRPTQPELKRTFDHWLIQQAEQRTKEKHHTHSLADYGISEAETRRAFATYLQFLARGDSELDSLQLNFSQSGQSAEGERVT